MTRVMWLGHSGFQIDTGEHLILIDPFVTGNPVAPVAPGDLQADFILLTHGHGDHVGDTVAIAKRTGATVVGNFEVGNWIARQGVQNVETPNLGGSKLLPFGMIELTIAFHSSSMPDGSYGGSPHGYLITLNNGLKIYHAGDTALFSDLQLIGEKEPHVAILPIGDFFTMGPRDSVRATQWLAPQYVIPVHYNTFPPIVQDAGEWANLIHVHTKASAIVLDPGGHHEF